MVEPSRGRESFGGRVNRWLDSDLVGVAATVYGFLVTLGRGSAVVVSTGRETELGRIAGSLKEIGRVETPLQARIARLARLIGLAVLVFGALGFGLDRLRQDRHADPEPDDRRACRRRGRALRGGSPR